MSYAIAVDSSADLVFAEQLGIKDSPIAFNVASLKIIAGDKEYVDDESINVEEMMSFMEGYNGKSGTACPSVGEWTEAFGDADYVFGVSITSQLSGSYESAMIAKQAYETEHPGRRVYIVDSLSTGPEMWLIAEKLRELIEEGLSFDDICSRIEEYKNHTRLAFMLESLKNLANNGRVSPAVAKIAGLLGIRIVGRATAGELDPDNKCRGEKKALATLVKEVQSQGYKGGKIRIHHALNENAANELSRLLKEAFPGISIDVVVTRGLDSFYVERRGLLVGYEV